MDVSSFYPARPGDARKGDFGRVLVAGGSERYAGAVAFNALAALRSGADIALVLAPRRAADIVAGYAPDLITVPCDAPFPEASVVAELGERVDALVLGGGVVRTHVAHESLRDIVREWSKPLVADAEALHAVAGHEDLVRGKPVLLTPHGGEYEVLAGEPWPPSMDERKEAARRLAKRYGCAVIVKGRFEVVSDGRHTWVDEEGSPYLTKGGYGDLLAGSAGALVARGASPAEAARVAAFIVGSAGARAAASLGESTVASDALARIPEVLSEALSGERSSGG